MLIGLYFKICRKVTTIFGYKQVFIVKKCRFFVIVYQLVQMRDLVTHIDIQIGMSRDECFLLGVRGILWI